MRYYSRQGGDATEPNRIGFIVTDGTSSFDLWGSVEAFAAARVAGTPGDAGPYYECVIIGVDARSSVASSGAAIKAHHTIRNAPALDTIVIPGGGRAAEVRGREKNRLLVDPSRQDNAAHLRGLCRHLSAGKHRPGIAALEMSLALIEEDYGRTTAVTVARELSIELRPDRSGREIAQPEHQPGPAEQLAELPASITSRLHRNLAVEVLAESAGLSPRHFYRLFRETFKKSPPAFVGQLRVDEAKRRLAVRRESVDSVAASVGLKVRPFSGAPLAGNLVFRRARCSAPASRRAPDLTAMMTPNRLAHWLRPRHFLASGRPSRRIFSYREPAVPATQHRRPMAGTEAKRQACSSPTASPSRDRRALDSRMWRAFLRRLPP